MSVRDDLLDAGIESHVLCLQAASQLLDSPLELIHLELLNPSIALGNSLLLARSRSDDAAYLRLFRILLS